MRADDASQLVSIGMPVYNGEDTIAQAVDSLLAQTHSNFELIISDNASTDDTERICRDYAEADKRVRYVRQPENIGMAKNFAYVLELATGEYYMWAAADDRWGDRFVEVCLGGHQARENAVGVMTDSRFGDDAPDPTGVRPITGRTAFGRQFSFLLNPGTNSRYYSLYRISSLRRINVLDYQFHAGDWAMLVDLLDQGCFYTEFDYVGFFKADGGAGSDSEGQASTLLASGAPRWFPLIRMTRYILSRRKLAGIFLLPAVAYLNYTNYKYIYRKRGISTRLRSVFSAESGAAGGAGK